MIARALLLRTSRTAARTARAASTSAPKFNKTSFREPDPSKPRLVLAYSGGLDTSCQLSWLAKEKGFEVRRHDTASHGITSRHDCASLASLSLSLSRGRWLLFHVYVSFCLFLCFCVSLFPRIFVVVAGNRDTREMER
jgi:hypothetical protein